MSRSELKIRVQELQGIARSREKNLGGISVPLAKCGTDYWEDRKTLQTSNPTEVPIPLRKII